MGISRNLSAVGHYQGMNYGMAGGIPERLFWEAWTEPEDQVMSETTKIRIESRAFFIIKSFPNHCAKLL
jgi:hypothetical protein